MVKFSTFQSLIFIFVPTKKIIERKGKIQLDNMQSLGSNEAKFKLGRMHMVRVRKHDERLKLEEYRWVKGSPERFAPKVGGLYFQTRVCVRVKRVLRTQTRRNGVYMHGPGIVWSKWARCPPATHVRCIIISASLLLCNQSPLIGIPTI